MNELIDETLKEKAEPKMVDFRKFTLDSFSKSETVDIVYERFMNRFKYGSYDFYFDNWHKKYDIENLLDGNSNFIKISSFLPEEIAERIFTVISSVPFNKWNVTEPEGDDYNAAAAAHLFLSIKKFSNSNSIFYLFNQLFPHLESTFSAGRYTQNHFIEPHDDKAYRVIDDKTFSRYIACVYYLTPNWKETDGGLFKDCEVNKNFVPEWNSAIFF